LVGITSDVLKHASILSLTAFSDTLYFNKFSDVCQGMRSQTYT